MLVRSHSSSARRTRPSTVRWAAALGALALAASACGGSAEAGDAPARDEAAATGDGVTLHLVGFAVPKAANNAIQALFAQTPEGEGVSWNESYGASGEQSRAVTAGLEADYVHLSLEGHVTRLVDAGIVAEDWADNPHDGIVSDSVVVFAVREGNPKDIQTWDDLVAPGVGIVTPNPGSSGSARWNIMAAYGQALEATGSEADAEAYLTRFFENVVALPGSGRDATTAFLSGAGDVLMTYENEAILARQNGEAIDYVVPSTTLLIENPGAVTVDAPPVASDWLAFLYTPQAQAEFARLGFRPVIDGVAIPEVEGANDPADPFPTPERLLTIGDDFGGWPVVDETFFDAEDGIVTRVQVATGKSS